MRLRNVITYLTAAAIAAGSVAAGTAVTNVRAEETTEKEYTILCAGDSITDGYINGDNGYRKYLCYYLQQAGIGYDMVGDSDNWTDEATYNWNGTTITYDPANSGHSGYAIQQYGSRSGLYETMFSGTNQMTTYDPDVVMLMIGTNDLLDARLDKTSVNDSVTDSTTALERLEKLVDEVIANMDSTDILILGSVPYIDTDVCPSWVTAYGYIRGVDTSDSAALLEAVTECVDTYNAGVEALAAEKKSAGYNVAFCDINSVVDMKSGLYDGCHPNESGYAEMGLLWANTLIDCLDEDPIMTTTTTESTTTTTTTTEATTTTTTTESTTTTTTTIPETTTTTETTTVSVDCDSTPESTTTTTTTEETTTTTETTEETTTTTTATTTTIATTDDTQPTTTKTTEEATKTTEASTTTTDIKTEETTATTTTEANPGVKMGDVNGDGIISMVDSVWLQKYLVDLKDINELNIEACDMDGNGTINIFDALRVLKILVLLV